MKMQERVDSSEPWSLWEEELRKREDKEVRQPLSEVLVDGKYEKIIDDSHC